jgi:hypothetical protein
LTVAGAEHDTGAGDFVGVPVIRYEPGARTSTKNPLLAVATAQRRPFETLVATTVPRVGVGMVPLPPAASSTPLTRDDDDEAFPQAFPPSAGLSVMRGPDVGGDEECDDVQAPTKQTSAMKTAVLMQPCSVGTSRKSTPMRPGHSAIV